MYESVRASVDTCSGQKRTEIDCLQLELQAVVSCLSGALGTKLRFLACCGTMIYILSIVL